MIESNTNFDVIERLLKEYKNASSKLNALKTQLEEIKGDLKDLRKDLTVKSLNEKILEKNTLRDRLKVEISDTKLEEGENHIYITITNENNQKAGYFLK